MHKEFIGEIIKMYMEFNERKDDDIEDIRDFAEWLLLFLDDPDELYEKIKSWNES